MGRRSSREYEVHRKGVGGDHDGIALLLTHCCMAGNQPRMVAEAFSGEEVRFEFKNATGLASRAAGHMHRAIFTLQDDNTLTTSWTWRENGENAFTEVIKAILTSATGAAPASS